MFGVMRSYHFSYLVVGFHSFYFSFHCNEQLSTSNIVELNKKRKKQYELGGNSGLPWRKHKFRGRSSSSDHLSLISEISENERNPLKEPPGKDSILEQPEESFEDGSNFIGVSDNTLALDFQTKNERLPLQTFLLDQSSASSNSNVFKDGLNFLDDLKSSDKSTEDASYEEPLDLEETLGFESRPKAMEDQNPGFEAYNVYTVSEFGKDDIEFADADSKDAMLYSNDVAANTFLLSSGRWNLGQDARLGSRKPTIDQEFEQYFSMLML